MTLVFAAVWSITLLVHVQGVTIVTAVHQRNQPDTAYGIAYSLYITTSDSILPRCSPTFTLTQVSPGLAASLRFVVAFPTPH